MKISSSLFGILTAIAVCGTLPTAAVAQTNDNLLAHKDTAIPFENAQDDIFQAMKALDEVGAILEKESHDTAQSNTTTSDKINIDELLAAAQSPSTPDEKSPSANPSAIAVKNDSVQKSDKIDTIDKIDKIDKIEPKHNIQTAPAQIAAATTNKDQSAIAVKNDSVQKSDKIDTIDKVDKIEQKHNIQTAPAQIAAATTNKDQSAIAVKNDSVQKSDKIDTIDKIEPKHNIQTAPAQIAAATTNKDQSAIAVKNDSVQKSDKIDTIDKIEPKHNIQTAPAQIAAATTNKTEKTAPDGTKTTQQPQKATAPNMQQTTALSLAYVAEVYKLNGVDLYKKTSTHPTIGEIYQLAFGQKLVYTGTKPAIGDLAFFHNTYDRNRDGRWNDWHSLVGIVESIDSDDTITVLIYTTKIEKIQLNLKYPELKTRKGKIINSQLRPDEGAQIGSSAKLFSGFANLLGNISSVTVVDNWQPGMKLSTP